MAIKIDLSKYLAEKLKDIQPLIRIVEESTAKRERITLQDRIVTVNYTLTRGTPNYTRYLYQRAGEKASDPCCKDVKVVGNNVIEYTEITTSYHVLYESLDEFIRGLKIPVVAVCIYGRFYCALPMEY